ncbi:hypothetical protein [uncultured Pelagimonas sp.]|uniref:hypothetical protein n=1 Tax=uncultured Pelagimonas sp. TaxID=1618102 RepID=UPI00260EDEFB|nr:hypothetical protein [uncultured Pelagimonas sp.]
MVEIADIKDRESLEAWLNALPQDTEEEQARARRIAVTLAFRAAARVLPIWWEWTLTSDRARKGDLTALPILRSLLISSVAAIVPTEDIRKAAAASFAAAAASFAATTAAAATASFAADATARAAAASFAATASFAADATARAADATARAADAATMWRNFQSDAEKLVSSDARAKRPLWAETSPVQEKWTAVQTILQESGQSDAWAFWINWYNGLLNGTAPAADSPMMVEIALLPNEVWEDEEDANKRINEIWQAHLKAGLEREKINYNPETDVFEASVAEVARPDRLEFAVQRLTELRGLVDVSGNLSGALRGEMFLISNAVDTHRENAAMVWNNARSALALLKGNIASGGCPNDAQEPVVGLVETALVEVTNTLADEPAVLKVTSEPVTEADIVDDEAQAVLNLAAYAVAEVMEPALAAETKEAADLMVLPGQSRAMRVWATTRVAGRVMSVWIAARYQNLKSVMDETGELVEKVDRIVGGLASIGKKSAAASAAVGAVVYSEQIAAAVQAILKLAF